MQLSKTFSRMEESRTGDSASETTCVETLIHSARCRRGYQNLAYDFHALSSVELHHGNERFFPFKSSSKHPFIFDLLSNDQP